LVGEDQVTNGDDVSAKNRWVHAVWLAGFGVVATVIGTAVTANAQGAPAKADSPHRIVSLTSGHNDFRNALSGVAGDADWAVYEQRANTDIDTDYSEFGDTARDRLYALDTQGMSRRLPLSAADQALQATYLGRWSLVDDMLTLSSGSTSPVHWWNLADGTHGEGGTPDGYVFGSSPDGWVSASDGKIIDQPAAGGAEVVLGSPAGLSSFPNGSSSVGDDGYVVDASAGLLFSPWGPTSSYTTLAVPAADTLGGCGEEAYQAVVCWALNSNSHEVVLRMPTDGTAAVSTKLRSVDPEFSFALSADTTAWADEVNDGVRVDSVPAAGGAISTSTYSLVQIFGSSFGGGPIGTLGSFLVATGPPAHRSIGQTTSARTTPTQVALGTRATVHVGTGGLALAPHRVVYADDKHSANFADVYQRTLSGMRGLTVGKSHVVLQRRHASLQGLAASDSTIAVTTATDKLHSPGKLEVFNHGKTYSKRLDYSQSAVVDGHNVVYNSSKDLFFHELDARTGKTRKLPVKAGEFPDFTAVDHHLVYRHKRQVWEYPLRGGEPHRLLSLAGVEDLDSSFFVASGDQVALEYTTGGDVDNNDMGATVHVLYRSLDRTHKPAAVPGPVPRHCSVIAITSKVIDCSLPGKVVALSLRTGHRHLVFAPPNAARGGQGRVVGLSILGGRVTWESAAGTGEVGLLSAH
jgi:hypothetical protein